MLIGWAELRRPRAHCVILGVNFLQSRKHDGRSSDSHRRNGRRWRRGGMLAGHPPTTATGVLSVELALIESVPVAVAMVTMWSAIVVVMSVTAAVESSDGALTLGSSMTSLCSRRLSRFLSK